MKVRKIMSLCLAAAVIVGMVACGSTENDSTAQGGNNTQTEVQAENVTLKIGQANFAAHGTKAFAVVTSVVKDGEIVLAYIPIYEC